MKKTIKFLSLLLALFCLSFAFPVCALAGNYDYTSGEDYYFTSYHVDVNVREDNTYEITETIGAYFNTARHGIYRTIPKNNYVKRSDGSQSTVRAVISDIDVSEEYSVSNNLSSCKIQIGSENREITGAHTYTIKYNYALGEDKNNGFDEFYLNIIGDEWDAYIENPSFTITMPKEFDAEKLGFSTGDYGTVGTNDIKYTVNGNVIDGYVTTTLEPYQALTARLELENGYFYFNQSAYNAKLALLIGVPAIALAAVIILWLLFGRDKKPVKTVEFYPPDGMSSADVAYALKGNIDSDDLTPLLIELANEGLIEISELGKTTRRADKGDFAIKKLRNSYKGTDEAKRIFFDGLFENAHGDTVYSSDLEDSFYKTLNIIKNNYNTHKNRIKVFSEKSLFARIAGWLVSVCGIALCIYISTKLFYSTEKIYLTAAGIAIGVGAFIFAFFISKRTDENTALLGKIKGFKDFLELAEKDKLETLVDENPSYFYSILPYAYVLGVSKKWIKKFESIAMEPPEWYYSPQPYNYVMFGSFINRTMNSAAYYMQSVPSSSGGGGFSSGGGGFAGGGVGGGGGGSW